MGPALPTCSKEERRIEEPSLSSVITGLACGLNRLASTLSSLESLAYPQPSISLALILIIIKVSLTFPAAHESILILTARCEAVIHGPESVLLFLILAVRGRFHVVRICVADDRTQQIRTLIISLILECRCTRAVAVEIVPRIIFFLFV